MFFFFYYCRTMKAFSISLYLSYTHTLSLSLSYTHTLTHSISRKHSSLFIYLTHTHALTNSHNLSLSHTHTHTHVFLSFFFSNLTRLTTIVYTCEPLNGLVVALRSSLLVRGKAFIIISSYSSQQQMIMIMLCRVNKIFTFVFIIIRINTSVVGGARRYLFRRKKVYIFVLKHFCGKKATNDLKIHI